MGKRRNKKSTNAQPQADVDEELISPGVRESMRMMRPSELNRPRAAKTLIEEIAERKGEAKPPPFDEPNIRIIDYGSVGKRPSKDGETTDEDDGGIPDDEKIRLIQQTGILDRIPKPKKKKQPSGISSFSEDYLFLAILYTIPFCTIFAIMDTLIHRQYNQEAPITEVVTRVLKALPVLFALIYLVNRFRQRFWIRFLLPGASAAAGCYLLYILKNSPAYGVMRQCPGLATLWIFTVFMMDLWPALGSLLGVGIYYLYTQH
jgi:hypothetical protein